MLVNLRLIGQVLKGEEQCTYSDFYTQLKGRNIQTQHYMEPFIHQSEETHPYFTPIHQSLKENQRLEHLIQFPPS